MKKKSLMIVLGLSVVSITAYSFNRFMDTDSPQHEADLTCKKATIESARTNNSETNSPFDAYIQERQIEFSYDINYGFINLVSKEKLQKAKTIWDILPEDAPRQINPYKIVEIAILHKDNRTVQKGSSESLNQAQKELLQQMDYQSNLRIFASYQHEDEHPSGDYLSYYMTVTPNQVAVYSKGNDELVRYLKSESKKEIENIDKSQLKPGKIEFTISQKGEVVDYKLQSTCGYKAIDMKMLSLINNLPEKWIPAKNEKGEAMEQTIYFDFGIQGC